LSSSTHLEFENLQRRIVKILKRPHFRGFNITDPASIPIVVETCTNLACPVWVPVRTNTRASGSCCFSELLQTTNPGRFYRIRSP
jgi:hypothetical protein